MIAIQETAIDACQLTRDLENRSSGFGATVTFTGTMRELSTNQNTLKALYLEHYPIMTERSLTDLLAQATERFGLLDATLVHRVGTILPDEPIVYVAATSEHRQAAFDACQMVMDYLKNYAPFWKKEIFTDGTELWVEQKDSDQHALQKWQTKLKR